jgi:hypothetical protein
LVNIGVSMITMKQLYAIDSGAARRDLTEAR